MTIFLQQRQEKCGPCTETVILVLGLDMICIWENSGKKCNKTLQAISKQNKKNIFTHTSYTGLSHGRRTRNWLAQYLFYTQIYI